MSNPFGTEELTPEELVRVTKARKATHAQARSTPEEGKTIKFFGKEFLVFKNVYYAHGDTEVILDSWNIEPGDHVIDIGTGIGVLAIFAAYEGAEKVVAVDIAKEAVAAAKANAEKHGFADKIEVRLSDTCENVRKEEMFDVVVANLPFTDQPATDVIEKSTYDENFKALKGYFRCIGSHLKENGRAYITRGNYGGVDEIWQLAQENNFKMRKIGEFAEKESPRIFYAFELTR